MQYEWDPKIPAADREAFQRILDRFPDQWLVHISHNRPDQYGFWFKRGAFQPHTTLYYDGRPLESYTDELRSWFYRYEKGWQEFIQAEPYLAHENEVPVTLKDYIRIRTGDMERTMSGAVLQERLDRGLIKGLEFLKDMPRVRPVQTRPERLAHDKGQA